METLFCNAHIVSPGLEIPRGAMLIRENRIAGLYPETEPLPEAGRKIDLDGKYLLPGFFDIHFHGRDNCDFSDASDSAIRTIARGKLAEGVTSFLVTTLSVERETITEICRAAARYAEHPESGTDFRPGRPCFRKISAFERVSDSGKTARGREVSG